MTAAVVRLRRDAAGSTAVFFRAGGFFLVSGEALLVDFFRGVATSSYSIVNRSVRLIGSREIRGANHPVA
jgi:hypothetical protein